MQRNNESGLRSYYTANGMFGSPPSSPHEASNNPPPPVLFSHSLGGGAAPPSAAVAAPLAEPVKRKRGRPRKYGAGTASPSSASVMKPLASPRQPPVQSPTGSSASSKRKEASKKAQMSGLGNAGQGFTPHVITIAPGEDVALNIMSFMQQRKRAVCIITACGSISNACIRQQAMLSGNTTYEGHYEILSLSGSYLPSETAGAFSRTGGLSICLSGADGDIVGGGVGGPIVAAGPVQVIAGSFVIDSDKDSNAGSVAEPKLSAPSIARPSVFSPPHFRSPVDSTARFFSNRSDDHLAGGATNFMLQSCATNVMPSRSTDWTGIRGGGHGGLHSPIDDDDEHTHD